MLDHEVKLDSKNQICMPSKKNSLWCHDNGLFQLYQEVAATYKSNDTQHQLSPFQGHSKNHRVRAQYENERKCSFLKTDK